MKRTFEDFDENHMAGFCRLAAEGGSPIQHSASCVAFMFEGWLAFLCIGQMHLSETGNLLIEPIINIFNLSC